MANTFNMFDPLIDVRGDEGDENSRSRDVSAANHLLHFAGGGAHEDLPPVANHDPNSNLVRNPLYDVRHGSNLHDNRNNPNLHENHNNPNFRDNRNNPNFQNSTTNFQHRNNSNFNNPNNPDNFIINSNPFQNHPSYQNNHNFSNHNPRGSYSPPPSEVYSSGVQPGTSLGVNVTLGTIERIIPTYTGKPEDLDYFIDTIDSIFQKMTTSENEDVVFNIVRTKIKGQAYNIIRSKTFYTWPQLKNFLILNLRKVRTIYECQKELATLKQAQNERVVEFSNKVETLLAEIIRVIKLEIKYTPADKSGMYLLFRDLALESFIMGLQKDISIVLRSNRPATLNEALQAAIKEETRLKGIVAPEQCQYCDRPGHGAKNCRFLPSAVQRTNNSNNFRSNNPNNLRSSPLRNVTSGNPNQFDRVSSNQTPPNLNSRNPGQRRTYAVAAASSNTPFCRYCKQHGHLITECSAREQRNAIYPPKTCPYCSHIGHREEDCRKKQADERAAQNSGAVRSNFTTPTDITQNSDAGRNSSRTDNSSVYAPSNNTLPTSSLNSILSRRADGHRD